MPSLTLPSISEDDENVAEEGEESPVSPHRSPLDSTTNRKYVRYETIFDR